MSENDFTLVDTEEGKGEKREAESAREDDKEGEYEKVCFVGHCADFIVYLGFACPNACQEEIREKRGCGKGDSVP